MKTRLFTSALLLAVSLSSFAQDKAALKAATQKMIDLNDQQAYSDLVGTVYPKYFEVVAKDQYYENLQKRKQGDGYTVNPSRVDPSIDYGAVKKSGNVTFCLVNYDTMMSVALDKKLTPQETAAKEEYFKKLFNSQDVYYIVDTNTIDVKKRVQLVAIADESTLEQWSFIDPTAPGASEILPEAIRKELDPENTEAVSEIVPEQTPEAALQAKYSEAKKAEEAKKKSVQKKP